VTEEVASEIKDEANEIQKDVEVGTLAGEQYRRRRPNMNFREMEIPIGSILNNTASDVEVTVTSDKKVRLSPEDLFLTQATKRVLNLDYNVAPGPYWTYNGRLLQDIYDETYPFSD
jgi:hypothetical protein